MGVLFAGVVNEITTDVGGLVDFIINPDVFLIAGIAIIGLIIWAAVRPDERGRPWRR